MIRPRKAGRTRRNPAHECDPVDVRRRPTGDRGEAFSGRKAIRHRKFPQLFREFRGVRAGRPGIRRGIPSRAGAPSGEIRDNGLTRTRSIFLLLAAVLLASRLCHVHILWEGDTLPLAAAGQMLHGKVLYRDIWFDKPPLTAAFYLLSGARPGWPLRLLDAAVCAAGLLDRMAASRATCGRSAKACGPPALLGFFLIFDFPAAVIPVASDLLMLAPHLAAVWMACARPPVLERRPGGRGSLDQPQGGDGAGDLRHLGARRNPVDGRGLRGGLRRGGRLAVERRARWRHIGKRSGRGAGSTPAARSSSLRCGTAWSAP